MGGSEELVELLIIGSSSGRLDELEELVRVGSPLELAAESIVDEFDATELGIVGLGVGF